MSNHDNDQIPGVPLTEEEIAVTGDDSLVALSASFQILLGVINKPYYLDLKSLQEIKKQVVNLAKTGQLSAGHIDVLLRQNTSGSDSIMLPADYVARASGGSLEQQEQDAEEFWRTVANCKGITSRQLNNMVGNIYGPMKVDRPRVLAVARSDHADAQNISEAIVRSDNRKLLSGLTLPHEIHLLPDFQARVKIAAVQSAAHDGLHIESTLESMHGPIKKRHISPLLSNTQRAETFPRSKDWSEDNFCQACQAISISPHTTLDQNSTLLKCITDNNIRDEHVRFQLRMNIAKKAALSVDDLEHLVDKLTKYINKMDSIHNNPGASPAVVAQEKNELFIEVTKLKIRALHARVYPHADMEIRVFNLTPNDQGLVRNSAGFCSGAGKTTEEKNGSLGLLEGIQQNGNQRAMHSYVVVNGGMNTIEQLLQLQNQSKAGNVFTKGRIEADIKSYEKQKCVPGRVQRDGINNASGRFEISANNNAQGQGANQPTGRHR